MCMPSTTIIRATQSPGLYTPYKEGIVRITPDAPRFVTASDGSRDKLLFSVNSNGLFSLSRRALLGATESNSTFPRLEISMTDGLRFGSGIRHQLVGHDRDIWRVDSNGDVYCMNRNGGLLEAVTSNACPAKGTLPLEAGGLTVSGRAVVTVAGEIVWRVNLDSPEGFKVSPSGYLTVDGPHGNC